MYKQIILIILTACMFAIAEEMPKMKFDSPDLKQGLPALQAISLRHSSREFRRDAIAPEYLGNLLWACCGYNRENKRTAPSAMNWQEISVYAVASDGIWLYDAKDHSACMVVRGDFRARTGMQPFVAEAPLNLLFVADSSKCGIEALEKWGTVDAAFCAANAGIYCAAVGLGGVVRGSFPADELAKVLGLTDGQKVVLAMSIGWPL